ncbi:GumC family protein [Spirosoma aerolatum]|uniref:GumC family protein n=1 Tax=Spirosoma aerolatum TaxID=1211326 RepID=UPI0009AE2C5A|nr:tyrosine-protein kinase [Spirosoma aerolatum]
MNNPVNNYSYVSYQNVDSDAINLRAIVFRYLRNWYWFVLSIGLMLAGAYIYLRYQAPSYKSQSSLLIKDEKKGLDQENILKELEIFAPKKVVENEIEILKSYTLMDRVAKQLNLNVFYYQDTPYGKREIYEKSPIRFIIEQATPSLYNDDYLTIRFNDNQTFTLNDKPYPLNSSVQTPYGRIRLFTRRPVSSKSEPVYVSVVGQTKLVSDLVKKLKAEPTSKASTVIMLTLETAVPDKGEAILNRLIEVYNEAAILDKNRVAANTLNFIDERLKLISSELQSVERGVEAYKSAQGITDLGVQAEEFLKTVQENDAQLNQVTIQLGALNDLEHYIKQQPGNRAGTPATLGLSDPTLLALIENVTKLEAQRDMLARTTSDQNPVLQTIDSQIHATKNSILDNVATMKAMLTTAKQQYAATNSKMEGVIRSIPTKERALMDITRQQAIKNNLYTYLLQKREETAVSFASTISDSRTVDVARSDAKPVKPDRPSTYVLFAFLGLLLPVGVLATSDAMNNRIMRRKDVEEGTNVPILGEVIKNKNTQAIIVEARNQSVIAEQIRALRTNLQFLRESREGSQALLFTSSISGEGKSFISLNLGASLALVGRRTVILEMDLRKPRLRHSLENFPVGTGISNYLIGEAGIEDIIQPIPNTENYYIITSGPIPPNPSELLSSPRLETLIQELRQHFDYVIIDAPPIGLVTDAQLIAPFADATLFIVRHDLTPKSYMKMVETIHQEKRFNKLNIVLNAVGGGDEEYYSYSYGYNYAYGEKKSSKKWLS